MDKKVREILEAPFPDAEIKQRKGSFGVVHYVDGSNVIQRLNDVFDAEWSFEIVEHKFLENEVLVLAKLTAGGIVKMAFGGSSITRNRDTDEIVSLVDDAKAACMDAVKKSASWLGVGLEQLYTDSRSTPPNGRKDARVPNTPGRNDNGQKSAGNGEDRLSQRQLSAIYSLARKAGYSSDEIRKRSIECFKVPVEQLRKTDASSLIGDLSNELGDGAINGKKS